MAESRIDELRRRLERDPESRLFAQLAEELRKDGDLEEAIGVARAGLGKHPNYPSARLTLGRALLDSGDPVAARTELEIAVQGAPDNILASRLLGEALETIGDLGSALDQYSRTLMMAPGDRQIEARLRDIQARLGAAVGAPAAALTEPEPVATAPEVAPTEDEEEDLPPTIRIRMPGDPPRPGRAPLPPVPREGRPEVTQPSPGAAAAPTAKDEGRAPVTDAEVASSQLPGTLPISDTPTSHGLPVVGVEGLAGSAADGGVKAPMAEGAGAPPEARPETPPPAPPAPPPAPSAAPPAPPAAPPAPPAPPPAPPAPPPAPSAAPPAPSAAPPAPPAAPAGVVGDEEMVHAGVEQPIAAEEPPAEPEAVAEAADEGEGGRAPVPTDAVPQAPVPSGQWTEAPEPPPPEVAMVPEVTAPDAAGIPGIQGSGAAALSSATLAELYLEQGLQERAVEVYRQVLEEDPRNEAARERLEEIESRVADGMGEAGAPEAGREPGTEARRQAIERSIERLEALLAVVRRR